MESQMSKNLDQIFAVRRTNFIFSKAGDAVCGFTSSIMSAFVTQIPSDCLRVDLQMTKQKSSDKHSLTCSSDKMHPICHCPCKAAIRLPVIKKVSS